MRPRVTGRVVLLVAVLATVIVTASASGTPGPARHGGTAYAAPHSGGTAYGSALPKPDKRPVATQLTLTPRRVVAAGELPQISFRVRQRGVKRVNARIAVLRMPSNRKLTSITVGWVRTGRAITVRWPRGISLRAGRYLVRLHATDSRGHRLKRSGKRPGRAVIVVSTPPTNPLAPPLSLPPAAPSPGGRGVFPVGGVFDFGGPDARFGAGRAGHQHQGQDIMAASGTPVVAPYGGAISSTSYQDSGAGEYVVLDGADGRDYFFAHCVRGSTTVRERQAVVGGQRLCAVGASGTASGPHLHFEIWNVGWRVRGGYPIDPLPELRAWAGR